MRIAWSDYFLGIADAVSRRADCTRSAVGAVLVDQDRRVISTGYNGSPPKAASCLSGGCPRGLHSYESRPPGGSYADCIARHAEFNAIAYAPIAQRAGATIYITRQPCDDCMELIAACGVAEAVWPGGHWSAGEGRQLTLWGVTE